ncbi:MAG: helix-turn-helix transcriptional regulator [Firmicutes bacterium]|nr:helix-turn-helix transcriptional regulator [Bacillota bacterium]
MKKDTILDFIEKLEQNNETLKKWGELYKIEEDIISSLIKSRKEKGLSQKNLAKLTNLKQPAIARIESGAHSPQLNTLIKIADALELRINLKPVHEIDFDIYLDQYKKILSDFNNVYENYTNRATTQCIIYTKGGNNNDNITYQYTGNEALPA